MADNTPINATTIAGGPVYRDIEKAGVRTQVVTLDLGGAGAEALVAGSLPVTGAFFQATQPVSGAVAIAAGAAAIGSVSVSNFPASQAVSGAFFQATQPVSAGSLPLPAGAATEAAVAGVRTDLGTDGTTPPAVLGAGTGVRGWLRSIYEKLTGTLAVTGTFWQATQPVSAASLPLPAGASTEATLAALNTKVTAVNTGAVVLAAGAAVVGSLAANQSVNNAQIGGVATAVGSGVSGAGVQRVVLATDVIQPAVSEIRAATLHVPATALVNVGATCALPAPAAGLFHYITSVQLVKLYAVLGVASGAGVIITSTNLPGNPAWTTEQTAGAIGTAPTVINYQPTTPLKVSLAATATTFVAPAQLQTIWRWNVSYFTAA